MILYLRTVKHCLKERNPPVPKYLSQLKYDSTASWVIEVYLKLSVVISCQDDIGDLEAMVRKLRGGCPRATVLGLIALRWIGVRELWCGSGEGTCDNSFFSNEETIKSAEVVFI